MTINISSNVTASKAALALSKNTDNLNKSLRRLSSGSKLINSSDDAAGVAVSMKIDSEINRNRAVVSNIQNALSFTEVQDGALNSAARIVDRMSELKVQSMDVSKTSADKSNYNTEFQSLQKQLHSLTQEKFNGISLFAGATSSGGATTFGSTSVTVSLSTTGSGATGSSVSIHKAVLLAAFTFNGTSASTATTAAGATGGSNVAIANSSGSLSIDDLAISFFTKALENVSSLRAQNGATASRLMIAEDHLRLSVSNLEAASSRIKDVDVATESTRLAKYNILSQASAAMLAQANQAPSNSLLLL